MSCAQHKEQLTQQKGTILIRILGEIMHNPSIQKDFLHSAGCSVEVHWIVTGVSDLQDHLTSAHHPDLCFGQAVAGTEYFVFKFFEIKNGTRSHCNCNKHKLNCQRLAQVHLNKINRQLENISTNPKYNSIKSANKLVHNTTL